MLKVMKRKNILLFAFIISIYPAASKAEPTVLNIEGLFTTVDVMYYDGAWSDLEPSIDQTQRPNGVGQGERTWSIFGNIIIDDQVINPDREDYLRGRSADFHVLSYDINFGDIYSVYSDYSTDIFWLSPDSSLTLGLFDFGVGIGSRADSGSYTSYYSNRWLDYNDPNTIKVNVGDNVFAAIVRTSVFISDWRPVSNVPEPPPILLIMLTTMLLILARIKKET